MDHATPMQVLRNHYRCLHAADPRSWMCSTKSTVYVLQVVQHLIVNSAQWHFIPKSAYTKYGRMIVCLPNTLKAFRHERTIEKTQWSKRLHCVSPQHVLILTHNLMVISGPLPHFEKASICGLQHKLPTSRCSKGILER